MSSHCLLCLKKEKQTAQANEVYCLKRILIALFTDHVFYPSSSRVRENYKLCEGFERASRCFSRASLLSQRTGALSICSKKPVVLVENQMERAFPPEIFRKEKKYLQRYSSFLVFTGIIGKSLFHLIRPTSSMLLRECAGSLP